jgi:phosphatidate phosphatase PAH1
VAYYHSGMPLDRIFFVDTKSRVQQMHQTHKFITYDEMANNIEDYFPYYTYPRVGYM